MKTYDLQHDNRAIDAMEKPVPMYCLYAQQILGFS